MSIELPNNNFGFLIFIIILCVFECLFYIVGSYLAGWLGLQGWEYWIVTISFIIICNMLFVNVKIR